MGINSLLLNLKSITNKKHVSDYSGQSAGIDGYSWLHKALYSYGIDVGVHNNLFKFVRYFSKRIMTLLHYKVNPIVVFDGDKMPLKRRTEEAEYKNRKKNYELAMEAYKQGHKDKANAYFMDAITVTPEMARFVAEKLKESFGDRVTFMVAPYEADSQLAYLSKIDMIQVVITEDSDLLVFGAKVVFYKMDKNFNGDEIKLESLVKATEADLSNFSHDSFIHLCILTGCDYLASPRGIGFKTAYRLMSKHKTIEAVINAIKDKLPSDYYISFLSAYLGFKYQRVFCPIKSKIVSLNELDMKNKAEQSSFDFYAAKKCFEFWGGFDFLGKIYDSSTAKKIAYCEFDPITKESFISGYNTMYGNKMKEMAKIRSKGKKDTKMDKLPVNDGLAYLDLQKATTTKNDKHIAKMANKPYTLQQEISSDEDDPLNKYKYEKVRDIIGEDSSLVELMKNMHITEKGGSNKIPERPKTGY